jgi:polar amino acid transport system permease protein
MKGHWDWSAFFEYLFHPLILKGVSVTLWLTMAAVGIGLVIGFMIAFMVMSKVSIVNWLGKFYVWFWRGTPLLVQLIVIYAALPYLGIKLSVTLSALIGLGLNESAFMAEIVRGGITSISEGQIEASKALGMPKKTYMRLIVIPQALRFIVPAVGNRINGMLKMSSLASVISMEELMRQTQMLTQEKFAVMELFIVATIYYLLLTTLWGRVQGRLEQHFGRAYQETVTRT